MIWTIFKIGVYISLPFIFAAICYVGAKYPKYKKHKKE